MLISLIQCKAVPAYGTTEILESHQKMRGMLGDDGARPWRILSYWVMWTRQRLNKQWRNCRWNRAIAGNPYYEQELFPAVKRTVELISEPGPFDFSVSIEKLEQTDRFPRFSSLMPCSVALPFSRLFMNVRETAGLAYSIYSDYNPYTGLLMVESGVDHGKLVEAEDRIDAELTRLQTELVGDDELNMIKRLMKADYVVWLDQPGRITERVQNQELIGYHTTPEEWLVAVDAVSAEQVNKLPEQ